MRQEFLEWAKKKKLLDEANEEINDTVLQWLWITWQTAWRVAGVSQKTTMDKLRMERDAYEAEVQKVMTLKYYAEALAEPEEKL